MRTIIQHIGPLLGEVNTGSVFGQPNGSIANGQGFSPAPTPTPSLAKIWNISYYTKSGYGTFDSLYYFVQGSNIHYIFFTYNGNHTQASNGSTGPLVKIELLEDIQDTSAHMMYQLATDAKFTNIIMQKAGATGKFTVFQVFFDSLSADQFSALGLTEGQTLYLRVLLEDSSGNSLNRSSNTLEYIYRGKQ